MTHPRLVEKRRARARQRRIAASLVRVCSAIVLAASLVGASTVASHASGDAELQNDQVDNEEQDLAVDDGTAYLDSIGADPEQELEVVGYDEELGVEIYDSPLGELYVDETTASDALGTDLPDDDVVAVPGVGEVEYVVADFEVDDLSRKAVDEFNQAGVEVQDLFEDISNPPSEVNILPDADLVQAAGACDVPLGVNVIEYLEECVQSSEASVLSNEDNPEGSDPEEFEAIAVASPPSGCSTATTIRYISRISACIVRTQKINLIHSSGANVGSITVAGVTSNTTSVQNTNKFNNNAYVRITGRTGAAIGRTFNFAGKMECGFNCQSPSGTANLTGSSNWQHVRGSVSGNIPSGQTRKVGSTWKFTITSSGVRFSSQFNTLSVEPRCDNNTPQLSGRGCVYPSVVPVFRLSKTGSASGVAIHIQKALASGLTSNLSRASSATTTANRNKACPRTLKRDSGYECDEYPFASSNQGAASGGSARVPSGCRWEAITRYGSSGYSRCQVPRLQNQSGGTLLLQFYRTQRIIVNDKYKMAIA